MAIMRIEVVTETMRPGNVHRKEKGVTGPVIPSHIKTTNLLNYPQRDQKMKGCDPFIKFYPVSAIHPRTFQNTYRETEAYAHSLDPVPLCPMATLALP